MGANLVVTLLKKQAGTNANQGNPATPAAGCFNPPNCGSPTGYVPPVIFYDHTEGVAVLGGYVYRGTKLGPMKGIYCFGGLNGKIWGIQRVTGNWRRQLLLGSGCTISTFGEDEAGNLYLADYSSGKVFEIRSAKIDPGVLLLD